MGHSKFDELLTKLGTGKWNIMYFAATCFWHFVLPTQIFSGIYLAPDVGHICLPHEGVNFTSISIDSCSYFVNTTTPSGDVTREEEVPCTEWDFDTSIYTSTLTSEFKLVCKKSYLRATYQSIGLMATIFSGSLAGYFADRYGRRTVVFLCQIIYTINSIAIGVVTNFVAILAFRFLQGCFSLCTLYVLSLEICEVKNRSLFGIFAGLPWAVGVMGFGCIAYFIRDWRTLQLTVALPFLLLLPVIYLLDESPRWLILKGDHCKALKILKRASRLNKVELPPDHQLKKIFLDIQQEQYEVEVKQVKPRQEKEQGSRFFKVPKLLRSPRIRLLTSMLCINLFISSLVYTGLSLSGDTYSSDPFLYLVIGGLMEVPGYTLTAPLINWLGRKKPTCVGYFISGVIILSLAFIPSDISWLVLTLAMLGKMTNCGAFMIMFVYLSELFPTEVRLQGVGTSLASAQVGATITPYITDYVGTIIPWFPSVLFGASSFVAALVLIPLPETLGRVMQETVQELEEDPKKFSKIRSLEDEEEIVKLNRND